MKPYEDPYNAHIHEAFLKTNGLTRLDNDDLASLGCEGLADFIGVESGKLIFLDHWACYANESGDRILISQPYKSWVRLTPAEETRICDFADKHELTVRIDPSESWYYPGECHVIEFTRKAEDVVYREALKLVEYTGACHGTGERFVVHLYEKQ